MKKYGFILLMIISLMVGYSMYDKFSEAQDFEYYKIKNNKHKKLKIGVIGDSWVYRIDSTVFQNYFLKDSMNVDLLVSGHPGATSKVIYQNLFAPKEAFTFEFIIKNRPQYCIIIAGVNDSFRGFGKEFYSAHLLKIVKALIHYNIKPVILEIPDFGIEESQNTRKKFSIYRDKIWFFIKNENYKDIEEYRDALRQLLEKNNLLNDVILINDSDIKLDYKTHNELYDDALHLNEKGYDKLLKVFVQSIKKDIKH